VRRDLDEFTEFVAARSGALLRTAVLLSGGDRQHGEDLLQEANSGKVVDLATGRILGHIPISPPMDGVLAGACCPVFWSSDGHLLLSTVTRVNYGRVDHVLMSCEPTDDHLTCTRATDELIDNPLPAFSLAAP
jgi:hypothetical protein